ncbi:hypothetical protein PoB_004396500 [Plakobranchus ocellatus]|uniref:Uncharacterized protein n=1 Tax=Plakobranchus ocellatus TaxID=259542 RepID=A0AAV4BEC1_9GAST|nr:hypothetical protein PoB_004396500 [Plakobranchus ocellatus]
MQRKMLLRYLKGRSTFSPNINSSSHPASYSSECLCTIKAAEGRQAVTGAVIPPPTAPSASALSRLLKDVRCENYGG